MSKQKVKLVPWINILCAVLLLAVLVTQFLPFWTVEEDTSSISGYLWLANSHKVLGKQMTTWLGGATTLSNFAGMPALLFVLCVLGIALSALRIRSLLVSIVALLAGVVGTYQYLAMPIFQTGANWQLHLVFSILVLVGAVVSLGYVIALPFLKKNAKKEPAEAA